MSTGLIALIDDVVGIAKLTAASLDDATAQAARAGVKAAGLVVDDTAVTPRYVTGFAAERELPIIGRIALGSLRNKLLALLSWSTGPEIRLSMAKLVHPPSAEAAEWRGLPENEADLLAAIRALIEANRADREAARTGGGRAKMVARPEVRRAMAATEIYLGCGHDPDALIATLATLVARDDATEFHGVAGFHDAVEQYESVRAPERVRHLVSATKSVMCSYGYSHEVYEAVRGRLAL